MLFILRHDYLAESRGGKVKPEGDVAEALWFTPEEIYQRWEDLHDDTKHLLSLARVIWEVCEKDPLRSSKPFLDNSKPRLTVNRPRYYFVPQRIYMTT